MRVTRLRCTIPLHGRSKTIGLGPGWPQLKVCRPNLKPRSFSGNHKVAHRRPRCVRLKTDGNVPSGLRSINRDAVHANVVRQVLNEEFQQSKTELQQTEHLISSLPLVRGLRSAQMGANADEQATQYAEFRLYRSMNPIALPTHLVYDSIRASKKLTIDPLLFLRARSICQAISVFHIGTHLTGHPGYVHGALHCVLFDDLFARCAGMVFPSGVGMTVNLQANFRKPSLPDRVYVARVEVAKSEGRKVLLTGSIRSLHPFTTEQMLNRSVHSSDGLSNEEEQGDLVVDGSAIFVEPKFANSMISLFPRIE